MGPTGAGKSTFIKAATGANVQIADSLCSCTHEIQTFRVKHPTKDYDVLFIDTPGFDDTYKDNTQILEQIANWLIKSYRSGIKVSGVLYLHPITTNRMAHSSVRTLDIFQKICGNAAFSNIGLVTTCWDDVTTRWNDASSHPGYDITECEQKEKELCETFWKPLVDLGSKLFRFENTSTSAWNVINSLPLEQRPLLIQREMGDQHMCLRQTTAGRSLASWLYRAVNSLKESIERLNLLASQSPILTDESLVAKPLEQEKQKVEEQLKDIEFQLGSKLLPRGPFPSLEKRQKFRKSSRWNTETRALHASGLPHSQSNSKNPIAPILGKSSRKNQENQHSQTHSHHSSLNSHLGSRQDEDPSDSTTLSEARAMHAIHSVTKILDCIPEYQKLLSVPEKEAEILLDLLQKLIDSKNVLDKARKLMVSAMMRLCKSSGAYPPCLALKDVQFQATPLASGSYGDIFQGKLGDYTVSLKVNRVFSRSQHDIKHLIASYAKEAVVWNRLRHPNILPFYGIYRLDESYGPGRIALISPWMENGNISEYLVNKPDTARFPLVLDALEGLSYLHMHSIIHGDLKGANILITPEGSACLADFGLSSVDHPDILRWTSVLTVTAIGGTTRWQAPELMGDDETFIRPTLKSDIYSVGSVIYEILVGKVPYYEYSNNASVIRQVDKGKPPTKPSPTLAATLELTEEIWEIMKHCWATIPEERPTIEDVAERCKKVEPSAQTYQRATEEQRLRLFRGGSGLPDVGLSTPCSRDLRKKLDGYDLDISEAELEVLDRLATV
ncbi:hypothetical protein NP233_g11585 [Leucocoprinus birnbaumii]|uniref:Protein kinase domain-containing protein n=1 Tax=Leucocoprinus birnbaumii TaxID=56174 RepID=A0AAD5VJT5_9AGAR|nr:hypothetical protein NP233_g11585 [Leucocoprinus birnbaumii]